MLDIFRGQRPDVTPAQVAAVLVAGVPAIATLLSAFGIADLTKEQQDALTTVLTWSAVLAGLLIGGDATLRTARNLVDGKRDAAAMLAGATGGGVATAASAGAVDDAEADDAEGTIHVPDEQEFPETAGSLNGHGPVDDPDAVGVDA
jgi:hypothetical protein